MTRMQLIREKELGWSTKAVAKVLGIPEYVVVKTERHYSKIKFNRHSRISPDQAELGKFYGLPMDELLQQVKSK